MLTAMTTPKKSPSLSTKEELLLLTFQELEDYKDFLLEKFNTSKEPSEELTRTLRDCEWALRTKF